jgi:tetratricopeptide (TPR) repeat protein
VAGHYALFIWHVIKMRHLVVVFLYPLRMRCVWMTTLIVAILFAESPTVDADRANAREFTRIGTVLAESGATKEALTFYQRAITSDPDYQEAYELALPLWFATKQEGRAIAELERLTLRCPNCGFAWYALGALYRRAERYDLAILAYEVYLGRRPTDADAIFGFAMALVATKDVRAEQVLKRYLRLEARPERAGYREEAERLLQVKAAANPNLGQALRLLGLLAPMRAWVLALWPKPQRAIDGGDAEIHGS